MTWGFYIAQFTFLVGVAASAVMVVLPYYLHDYKAFGKMTILGEFLAIAAVIMCMLFIFVDMGKPDRVVNVILHPTPHSMMFWDMVVLGGYLVLNIVISRGHAVGRAARGAAAEVDQADHPPLDPLGGQHPHRHGVPLLRSRRAAVLDDRDPGAALPGLGLRRRPGAADPALPSSCASLDRSTPARRRSRSWR